MTIATLFETTTSGLHFMPLGGPEILILVFILVLLFLGPQKLPKLARSLGESTQEFKKGRKELEEEIADARDEPESETTADELANKEAENN